MSMERNIITMGESGYIIMPDNVASIWMSEPDNCPDTPCRHQSRV